MTEERVSSRRGFLELAGLGGAALASAGCGGANNGKEPVVGTSTGSGPLPATPPANVETIAVPGKVPRRLLGRTGQQVSILCLGGYHLGNPKEDDDATRIVHEAMEAGLDFFDNAWEYHDGKSEERLGKALVGKRDKAFVMTKVCTHGRDQKVAMLQLEDSLRRLKTDHIDLWQVHECVYDNDPERHFAPNGVIEALDAAKKSGKVRFVGFTGHKHPDIHLAMLKRGYRFDTCQLPINVFDATFRSFETNVLPELAKQGIAALGMKSLGGEGESVKKGVVTAEEAIRYALSQPIASLVSGIDTEAILKQNLAIARNFKAMDKTELSTLRARVAKHAADGRFELFKTTAKHEGKPGREQHGFPSPENVAS